ncbi:transglycosylase SLT domain-containing protein [Aliikangiella sp. IMCC44359]|uniref:transglycosylase SLT domain-containing protein n=1 Tax=Aliikangiella sp. IMCC44359 TaxID=3459125 RepID=UPI00403B15DD
MRLKLHIICLILLCLSGCATYVPTNSNNLCDIFLGETDWYEAARDAQHKWGTPIYVMMAIMHQESRFISDAQPERDWFLGIIPLPRSSSAYGYAQAQDPAWKEYLKATGQAGADRDDFEDAIDFIGWYTDGSQKRLKLSKWDAYGQYLAYHEGRGGYARKTYNKKPWLKKVANKVKQKAAIYNRQLKTCKNKLDEEVDSWF